MRYEDYVPGPDVDFFRWGTKAVIICTDKAECWGIHPPEPSIKEDLNEFGELIEICKDSSTRRQVDVRAKNQLRKKTETYLRTYLQGVVARNPWVSDEDRQLIGLRIRDNAHTPISAPEGQAKADVVNPGRTIVELRIKHVDGTPNDPRANYGVRIYYGVYAPGQPPPTDEEELRTSIFSRQKKVKFTFRSSDSGKLAYFCLRYENSRGVSGPWGPIFSAVIT